MCQPAWAQAHPAPHPPPVGPGPWVGPPARPTEANTESSRAVSGWPAGQSIGAVASAMLLLASNRASQVRHVYS